MRNKMEGVTKDQMNGFGTICLVCGIDNNKPHRINSSAGEAKHLAALIIKYGGIHYKDGVLCRNCVSRVLTLEKNEKEIFKKVQNTFTKHSKKPPSMENSPEVCPSIITLGPSAKRAKTIYLTIPQLSSSKTSNVSLSKSCKETSDTVNDALLLPIKDVRNILQSTGIGLPNTPVIALNVEQIPEDTKTGIGGGATSILVINQDNSLVESNTGSETLDQNSSGAEQPSQATDHAYCSQTGSKKAVPMSFAGHVAQCMETSINTPAFKEKLAAIDLAVHCLGRRKAEGISVLMRKNFEDILNITWEQVYEEFYTNFPEIFQLLLCVMVPSERLGHHDVLNEVFPRLGMIYAIMIQCRNGELNRVQRMMSYILMDSMCDWRVFDILVPYGICVSYNTSRQLVNKGLGHFKGKTLEARQKKNKQDKAVEDDCDF